MNVPDLIGRVVTLYLQNELVDDRASAEGTARYTIDCLTADQTAAIARQILGDPALAARVELKLSARFLAGQGLPEDDGVRAVILNPRSAPPCSMISGPRHAHSGQALGIGSHRG